MPPAYKAAKSTNMEVFAALLPHQVLTICIFLSKKYKQPAFMTFEPSTNPAYTQKGSVFFFSISIKGSILCCSTWERTYQATACSASVPMILYARANGLAYHSTDAVVT